MQPAWKILAPVNLTEDTGSVVEHAIEVAKATAGQLVLLHVLDGTVYKGARRSGWPLPAISNDGSFVRVQRVVLPGDPAETICRYAEFMDANMLLLTPRGRGDWTRLWKSSVTAKVLESTSRPVQVTNLNRLDSGYQFRCRKILCVLSLEGSDDPVIECATTLAARSGAEIALLHVLPEVSEGLLSWGIAQSDRPLSSEVARARIRDLGAMLPPSYTSSIMTGGLHNNIVKAANQSSADLIVAGHATPENWARGCPDARAFFRRVACPVLSVPVGAAAANAHPVWRYRAPRREAVACDV